MSQKKKCCEKVNQPCQVQKNAGGACYSCMKHNLGCKGNKGPLYDLLTPRGGLSAPKYLMLSEREEGGPNQCLAQKATKRKGKNHSLSLQSNIDMADLVTDAEDEGELPHKKRLAPCQLASKSQLDKTGKKKGNSYDRDT